MLIRVIEHNTTEWARMAKDLRQRGYKELARQMSIASCRFHMSVAEFDEVSRKYREWLNWGHSLYPVVRS